MAQSDVFCVGFNLHGVKVCDDTVPAGCEFCPLERSRARQRRNTSLPLWLLPSFLMADGCFIKRGGLTRHLVDSLWVPDIRFTFYLPIQSAFHPARPGNVTMETCSVVYQKKNIYIYQQHRNPPSSRGWCTLSHMPVTAHIKDLSKFKLSRRMLFFFFSDVTFLSAQLHQVLFSGVFTFQSDACLVKTLNIQFLWNIKRREITWAPVTWKSTAE